MGAARVTDGVRSCLAGQSAQPNDNRQPLVDVAFLTHGILRALPVLWHGLDPETQAFVIDAVRQCRVVVPNYNNWLLFAAMVETFLHTMGAGSDHMRIDVALRQHEAWYLGDGMYGDGPQIHWDHYNSYVIQPMLLDIVETMAGVNPAWDQLAAPIRARARRYAAVQERFRPGWLVPGDWALDLLSECRVSASGADGAARRSAGRCDTCAGTRRAHRRDAAHVGRAGHIRCCGMAHVRAGRSPAGPRGVVYFHRQPISLHRRLFAARSRTLA